MLNTLVCDDEKPFLERLVDKIADYLKVREITFQMTALMNGEELVGDCENGRFDTMLLDIGMDRLNGIEATGFLRKMNPEICTAFATGYTDYVLDGYKAGAFRYLVKDSLDGSFEECMEAVLKKFHIDMDKICLEFTDGTRYLEADEICLVESRGHKLLFLAASDQRVVGTVNRKLSEMESLLGRYGSLRVHQNYMVNMRYIVSTVSCRPEMQQKITPHISKNRYQYVKRKYALYKGEGLQLFM